MEQTRLPDLPELEEVEVGDSATPRVRSLYVLLGCSALAYISLSDLGTGIAGLSALAAIVALACWALFQDQVWKTDAESIETRNLFRTKQIRWCDVTKVVITRSLSSAAMYTIVAPTASITLNTPSGGQMAAVVASAWMHLRRQGRSANLDLPYNATSFWDVIPDDVPLEAAWTNKHWAESPIVAGVVVFMAALIASRAVILLVAGPTRMSVPMLLGAVLIANLAIRAFVDRREYTASVKVSERGLEVTRVKGSTSVDWSDIREIEISTSDATISFWRRQPRLCVPITDDDSSKLALAIIDRVRKAGKAKPIFIPHTLRNWLPSRLEDLPHPGTDEVTVRYSLFGKGILPVLLLWAAAYLAGRQPTPQSWAVLALGFAIAATVYIRLDSYFTRTDSEGVTIRGFWGSKTVRWGDIAKIDTTSYWQQPNLSWWLLKDANGRLLLGTWQGVGSGDDRWRLTMFAANKLRDRLPTDKPGKPWMSRPWPG